jgi:hypothetical protein
MAWRWAEKMPHPKMSTVPHEGWRHVTAEEALREYEHTGEFWEEPEEDAEERRRGFCGLAGKP